MPLGGSLRRALVFGVSFGLTTLAVRDEPPELKVARIPLVFESSPRSESLSLRLAGTDPVPFCLILCELGVRAALTW